MSSRVLLPTALLMNLTLCLTVAAQADPDDSASSITDNTPLPLCGVYCLYAYAKLKGHNVQIETLINYADVDPDLGVSIAQIITMATDTGLHAMPLKNLTETSLRKAPSPIILHLNGIPSGDDSEIDHYVLFLGVEGAYARIYDPPKPLELMPISELTQRWSGVGVLLSEDPIPGNALTGSSARRAVLTLLASLLILFGVHHLRTRIHPHLSFAKGRRAVAYACLSCVLIASVAILSGLLFHLLSPRGLFVYSETETFALPTSMNSLSVHAQIIEVSAQHTGRRN